MTCIDIIIDGKYFQAQISDDHHHDDRMIKISGNPQLFCYLFLMMLVGIRGMNDRPECTPVGIGT